nr:protein canopy homolog 3-like [Dermatophagoides farinae]
MLCCTSLLMLLFFVPALLISASSVEEEHYGVRYATACEVCKILALELENRFHDTAKSHDVIETGYTFDSDQRAKKQYKASELRLIESMDGICDVMLEYNIHKERKDSNRFAKGMSTTFQTLHGLVDKGVKVDLGIPYDLWDKPSAEITNLKTQCEDMMEKHEADIEQWYYHHQQQQSLIQYLCQDRVLPNDNHHGDTAACLTETTLPSKEEL